MSIGGILAALVIVVISLAWILYPILRGRRISVLQVVQQKQRDALLTDYERVLLVIRDLDEDFNTGKLERNTYEVDRGQWMERGALLLQQIEGVQPPVVEAAPAVEKQEDLLDDVIEQAVASYASSKSTKS